VAVGVAVALASSGALAGEKGTGKGKAQVQLSGTVNLNEATAAQLDLLPGVGEKAARKIIEYRQKTPFTKVEEIVKVKGFGKKKFDKMKPYLAVSGKTTLQVEKGEKPPAQGRSAPSAK
jgi:competence protein ComEA